MKTCSVAIASLVLVFCSDVQAQQRSLFGNRGPLAGPNGFATGTMGQSPAVQARSSGTTIHYQPGNSYAPTGMFNRQAGGTFGTSGIIGNFSRDLIGNREAAPSFNRGLPDPFPTPGWKNGVPPELEGVVEPVFPSATPAPTLPASFPQAPVEQQAPVEGPAVQADALPDSTDGGAPAETPTTRRPVRPELRAPGQATQARRPNARSRSVVRQSRKLSRQERFRDVTIGLEDGVWTLRGEVDSFEAKDLAEAFAALEPGVGLVRNEIAVRGAGPFPAE
jgi:hypothetical protein